MFPVVNPSQQPNAETELQTTATQVPVIEPSECNLASVLQLRDQIVQGAHEGTPPNYKTLECRLSRLLALSEIIQMHVFVGIVDTGRCLSLVQHAKKLYLMNHGALA